MSTAKQSPYSFIKLYAAAFAAAVITLLFALNAFAAPALSSTYVTTYIGKSVTVKATGFSGTVKWKTYNSNTARVTQSGKITGVRAGKTTVTATANKVTLKCIVEVKKYIPIRGMKFTVNGKHDVSSLELKVGDALLLKPEFTPSDASIQTVKWSTSNSAAVRVSSKGKIRAAAPGQAVIKATSRDNKNVYAKCTVTVTAAGATVKETEKETEKQTDKTVETEKQPETEKPAAPTLKQVTVKSSISSAGRASQITKSVLTVTGYFSDGTKEVLENYALRVSDMGNYFKVEAGITGIIDSVEVKKNAARTGDVKLAVAELNGVNDRDFRLIARGNMTGEWVSSTNINVDDYDGLYIPGGGDVEPSLYGQERHPQTHNVSLKRDKLQIALIKKFAQAGKPIVGICRGCQVINVAFGGTLCQHITNWHTLYRDVTFNSKSWLYNQYGPRYSVYHYHHQCVERVAPGFFADTRDAADGRVEGIQHETLPIFGIQWHPDSMGANGAPAMKRFRAFCLKYRVSQ